jgi:Flp pilus assembly protein CpaB
MEFASKLVATRKGALIVAAFTALLAFVSVLVYLKRYRESLSGSSEPVTVLVAKSLIPKGTPAGVIGSQDLYQSMNIPRKQVLDGALTNPASFRGRIAVDDIYPGQQLTVSDFSATGADVLGVKLGGDQRAISIPVDVAHGMVGQVEAGDHVDVYGSYMVKQPNSNEPTRAVLKPILQDALVLSAPESGGSGLGGGGTSNVVLRASPRSTSEIAFTVDNGKLWIVLRPRSGAPAAKPDLVTVETILFNVRPLAVYRSFGGRG